MVRANLTRDPTGRVDATFVVTAPGDGNPIGVAIQGEDVTAEATFTDATDTGVDADVAPSVTITHVDSGTEVVSGASSTSAGTGSYEYDWDTSTSHNGTGEYAVEATGEFSSETKVVRTTVELR